MQTTITVLFLLAAAIACAMSMNKRFLPDEETSKDNDGKIIG